MICENELDAGSVTLCAAAAAATLPRVAGRDKAATESDMAELEMTREFTQNELG